jgi:hypothetical protein
VRGLNNGGGVHSASDKDHDAVSLTIIRHRHEMELESDTYDVVVIGTGLAESIAAA